MASPTGIELEGAGSDPKRRLGLMSATGVGVGAIVGGGIFVLAGTAFASTGPSAVVAFAINGMVAFLTAMSFAELSSAFPESGGAYTFAKKILSLRSAFATGWVLWFAYIVAGVLYALGFASFCALAIGEVYASWGGDPPAWLFGRRMMLLLASGATLAYSLSLVRQSDGGGNFATIGKVVVFGILVLAGVVALFGQPVSTTSSALRPFFSGGTSGLVMAMGFTFIALQGFDLVAAVAGEVKDPGRVIPRAMFLSLGCALIIYVPLLLLVASVGVEPGQTIGELAAADPERVIPVAAERFMGPIGFWLVIIAAILSTLSALHANLLAASRIALTMANDRTLPAVLGDTHPKRGTPVMAIAASALTLIAIIFMIPDLAAAGAAASLIFLISFALAHFTVYLARRRGGTTDAPYKTPWFPAVPIAGGVACMALAGFQAIVVPDAAGILIVWLGLGGILYWSLFARFAEIADASAIALDPSLVSLRGHSPLVLVPIANPARTPALISVANALAARNVGRVLLLSVVPADTSDDRLVPAQLRDTQTIIYDALAESFASGHKPEALITAAHKPLEEIRRIAQEHRCASLLLGLGQLDQESVSQLEVLINGVDCDVALMHAPIHWHCSNAKRILVPVAGRGAGHELRARLLGSLGRAVPRHVTFITILPTDATAKQEEDAMRQVVRSADLRMPGTIETKILRADDPVAALVQESADYDLLLIGLRAGGWGKKVIGSFALQLTREAACATLLLSRRPPRAYELLDPLRNDVVDSLRDAARTANKAIPGFKS
jgi:amino acid transporter